MNEQISCFARVFVYGCYKTSELNVLVYCLKLVNKRCLRGTPIQKGEATYDHKKRRQKIAFSDETMKKLEWLVQEHKKRSKKRIYPCDTLSELIDNEYVIRKRFGNS